MRIFITGGSGFIGLPTVRQLLHKKHRLLLLSRDPKKMKPMIGRGKATFIKGNLSDTRRIARAIQKFKPDAALHMAWEGIPDYGAEQSMKNVAYGFNLFKMFASAGVQKIIATGSCWEYGTNSGKLSEEADVKPKNIFSASKIILSVVGAGIAKEYDIQFVWARIFFAYGPRQKQTSLIPCLLNGKKHGEAPNLKNPRGANDFIYIDDVARALVILVEKREPSQFSLYNIGSGALTKVKNIADFIYGKKKFIAHGGGMGFYADISKIKREIGWVPKVNITDGIRKMIKYYR